LTLGWHCSTRYYLRTWTTVFCRPHLLEARVHVQRWVLMVASEATRRSLASRCEASFLGEHHPVAPKAAGAQVLEQMPKPQPFRCRFRAMRRGSRRTQATTSYRDSCRMDWSRSPAAASPCSVPSMPRSKPSIRFNTLADFSDDRVRGQPLPRNRLAEIHDGLGFFIPDAKRPERADWSLDGDPENR
jgi:hypothetical protein